MPLNYVTKAIFTERGEYMKPSIFAKLFCCPDSQNIAEKQSIALSVGANTGFTVAVVRVLLSRHLTFKELVFSKKAWAALELTKGVLLGGFTACLYIGTAQSLCHYRGNKDDWMNHYIAGYVAFLPFTVLFRPNWRYYIVGGTIWGSLCALAKLSGQTDGILKSLSYRQIRLGQTKYPEVYAYQETLRDIRKLKAAGLYK